MTLLDRYFIERLFAIGLFAILVFTIAWLAPEILFKAIQAVSNGRLTLQEGALYLLYQVPQVLTYCIPISILFASVFFFRQLSLSSELTAILSSGISFRRLLLPVGVVGLCFTLLFFLTQEFFIPWSSHGLRDLNAKAHLEGTESTPQVTFVERSPQGAMDKFLIISPLATEAQAQFIFLFYAGQGDGTLIHRILTASKGQWDNALGAWRLKDGVDYWVNSDGIYQQVEPFASRIVQTSPIAHALLAFPTGNPAEFRLNQLERYVRLLARGGQTEDAKFYRVRLYQRYFLMWIALVFALLGTWIGVERSRAKRNMGLTYAAALLLFYNVMVPVSTTLGSIGILPELLAAVLPVLLAALAGGFIIKLRKSEG